MMESRGRRVLDAPHARGTTTEFVAEANVRSEMKANAGVSCVVIETKNFRNLQLPVGRR